MPNLIDHIRNLAARRGMEIRRVSTPRLRFEDFLSAHSLGSLQQAPSSVHVFDDDPRIQIDLIEAFGTARVFFHSFAFLSKTNPQSLPEPELKTDGRFWVMTNLLRCPLSEVLAAKQWIKSAEVLILRTSLSSIDARPDELFEAAKLCTSLGFSLYDIAIGNQPVMPNTAHSRVFAFFAKHEMRKENAKERTHRLQRLGEATAFFPNPLAQEKQFQWLTCRGSFGFEAGVFNPGAIVDHGKIHLLARGETVPWSFQKESEQRHFAGWKPLLMDLDESRSITRHVPLTVAGPLDQSRVRLEDFRLFRYRDQILSNHSVITPPDDREPREQPVQLDLQRARVGLSSVNLSEATLNFIGFPSLDLPVRSIEKNWAMMAHGDRLNLIYSLAPYRVLQLTPGSLLDFKTKVQADLALPFGQDGELVRNSINPVDYDERHYLHLVHKVYPSKQYVFWAMLIDKQSLLPAFVSDRPVVRSGASLAASILYVCSAVVYDDRVSFFGGVNDCGSGVWTLSRADLDRSWQALAPIN